MGCVVLTAGSRPSPGRRQLDYETPLPPERGTASPPPAPERKSDTPRRFRVFTAYALAMAAALKGANLASQLRVVGGPAPWARRPAQPSVEARSPVTRHTPSSLVRTSQ